MKIRNLVAFAAASAIALGSASALAAVAGGIAVVNTDGSIARQVGVKKVLHLGTGIYEVDFKADVSACAFTATTGNPTDGDPPEGIVTLAGRGGNVKGVFVATYDGTGAATDLNFHLNVRC